MGQRLIIILVGAVFALSMLCAGCSSGTDQSAYNEPTKESHADTMRKRGYTESEVNGFGQASK